MLVASFLICVHAFETVTSFTYFCLDCFINACCDLSVVICVVCNGKYGLWQTATVLKWIFRASQGGFYCSVTEFQFAFSVLTSHHLIS